jgi:hypothetical protein
VSEIDHSSYPDKVERLAGAYIAWDAHLGTHFCLVAAGTGECDAGDAILKRLHAALFDLLPEERLEALKATREHEFEDPY